MKTTFIVYTGPADEVLLDAVGVCKRGRPVAVPEHIANGRPEKLPVKKIVDGEEQQVLEDVTVQTGLLARPDWHAATEEEIATEMARRDEGAKRATAS
ncbi:MAG: hypothetical protein AB1705_14540 [Verrucomicrobiota bacterium]